MKRIESNDNDINSNGSGNGNGNGTILREDNDNLYAYHIVGILLYL